MVLGGFTNLKAMLGSGIYALTWRGEVVYVGQTKTLLERLWRHWHNRGKVIKREPGWSKVKGVPFDDIWIMAVPVERLDQVEREMIAKYRPRYNIKLVPKVDLPAAVLARLGLGRPGTEEGFVRRA